jgi:hypothetical protein
MAVDVKDINQHESAGTQYPGIAADELNILVERANADGELLKANLGEMISSIVTQIPSASDTSHALSNSAVTALFNSTYDPVSLLDGTKATYDRVMRNWFVSRGALTATSAELTALCDEWYTITRTGWNGYTTFNAPAVSSVSTGTKGGDNAGLSCTPSTDTVANTDDYAGLPLFAVKDCNWTVDADTLDIVITAIDGITSNFRRSDADAFVGVLQMAPYHWYDSTDTTYVHGISDAYQPGHDICKPVPEAVKVDGTMRPWVCHGKYAGHIDQSLASASQVFECRSGVTPTTGFVSHNTSQTYARRHGTQYSGMCGCDHSWLVLMLYIKYASLTADALLQGCVNYYRTSASYVVAHAETGTTRLLVSASTAAQFITGSMLRFGSSYSYGDAASYDVSGVDGAKLLSKETVTVDGVEYVALNTDAQAAFDTTTSTYITSWMWRTGSCDAVLGNDGSPNSCTNGQNPAKLQGIEYMYGAYEVPSDTILSLYTEDSEYWYEPCTVGRSAEQTTSLTSDYTASGITIAQPENSSWQYIKRMGFNGGIMFPAEIGGSSSTYTRDGFYMNGATTGLRGWLLFGALDSGSGKAGLSACDGAGLGTARWHICGRLSPNGNRGEWTA